MELTAGRRITDWLWEDEEPFESQYGTVTTERWLRHECWRLGTGYYIVFKYTGNGRAKKMVLANLNGANLRNARIDVKRLMLSLDEVRGLPEPRWAIGDNYE